MCTYSSNSLSSLYFYQQKKTEKITKLLTRYIISKLHTDTLPPEQTQCITNIWEKSYKKFQSNLKSYRSHQTNHLILFAFISTACISKHKRAFASIPRREEHPFRFHPKIELHLQWRRVHEPIRRSRSFSLNVTLDNSTTSCWTRRQIRYVLSG